MRAHFVFTRDFNIMRLALICAAALLASSSLAAAAEPTANTSGAVAKKEDIAKKTRKVCRREMPTGSTIRKRVCRAVPVTNEESEAAREPQAGTAQSENVAANR